MLSKLLDEKRVSHASKYREQLNVQYTQKSRQSVDWDFTKKLYTIHKSSPLVTQTSILLHIIITVYLNCI